MSSPFRSRTPRLDRSSSHRKSPFPINSIPNTPPRSFLTDYDETDDCLDIRKVDHDAIINDLEIKNLTRGHSFEGSSRDPLFTAAQRKEEDEEDEFDEYSELEWLVNNPAAESRQRMLAYRRRQNRLNSTRLPSPPPTLPPSPPSPPPSPANTTHWIAYLMEGWIGKTIIKPIVFILFMLFWITKEPIIRIITFLTMIVSAVLVDPIVYLSSLLAHYHMWVPTLETRHRIAHLLTVTMVTLASLYYLLNYPPHLSLDWLLQHQNWSLARSYVTQYPIESDVYQRLATYERLSSQDHIQLEQFRKQAREELDRLWHKLAEQSKHAELEDQKIWSVLQQQQARMDQWQQRIRQDIQQTIAAKLPEQILVHTDQQGKLSLSPQFYQYLQDHFSWPQFLKQNEAAMSDYLHGQMNKYLERQKKEGAIISKERFMKLLATDLSHPHLNKLDTTANFHQLVEQAIRKYHQDVLNTPDFALASRGGFVLHSKTSPTHDRLPIWMKITRKMLGLAPLHNYPENALHPATLAGECWSMAGQEGTLGIMLSQPIYVQSVTIEHPSSQVLLDQIDSAPQSIEFYGIQGYPHRSQLMFLGKAYYDINKPDTIQTFDVYMPTQPFQAVIVKIKSNWGNPKYTDLYRVRFHGTPAK